MSAYLLPGEAEIARQLTSVLKAKQAQTLVIAGSGLGGFVGAVDVETEVSYSEIPGVGASTVAGHSGKLIFGRVGPAGVPALIMAGRRHLYEGLSPAEALTLPRLVLTAWPQLRNLIISNAAGGLNPAYAVGDLMLLSDHINFQFRSPLRGALFCPAGDELHRPVYDKSAQAVALQTALELQIPLRRGVYLAMMGPSYETRAEISMIRHVFQADAVGMSTAPEAVFAAALGRRVLGISFISNMLVEPAPLTHEEVVQNSALVEEKFSRLVAGVLQKFHES